MKQSLYGKYPGVLKYDIKYVENCSEMELFILVSKYYEVIKMSSYYKKMISFYENSGDNEMKNHFIKKLNEEMKKCPLLSEKPQEFYYALNYCLLQTARFNTKITYNPDGQVNITDDFTEWYNNWQLYVNTMDENELQFYRNYRYEGKSLEYFNRENVSIIEENYWENIENLKTRSTKVVLQKNIRQLYA